jgi:hypothetical protein
VVDGGSCASLEGDLDMVVAFGVTLALTGTRSAGAALHATSAPNVASVHAATVLIFD